MVKIEKDENAIRHVVDTEGLSFKLNAYRKKFASGCDAQVIVSGGAPWAGFSATGYATPKMLRDLAAACLQAADLLEHGEPAACDRDPGDEHSEPAEAGAAS